MAYLAERYGASLESIPGLGPRVRPLDDLRALVALVGVVRRFRPDIVHTHTAKAGFLGRLAALIAVRPRPSIVHTYHGHVLEGYFGRWTSLIFRLLERVAASFSDRLIGVSDATVEDLIRLQIARREKFRIVPLGLDLAAFLAINRHPPDAGAGETEAGVHPLRLKFRREYQIAGEEVLASYVGRIVPIKRLDLVLRAIAEARSESARLKLVVVGDGDSRHSLEELARVLGIGDYVQFLGYSSDLDLIAAGADLAVLASDNEGTPVSLIEAAAAGLPCVATDVGGVSEVVRPDSGLLVSADDPRALGQAMAKLVREPGLRHQMGERAREHVARRFSAERLLRDIASLYEELLRARPPGG